MTASALPAFVLVFALLVLIGTALARLSGSSNDRKDKSNSEDENDQSTRSSQTDQSVGDDELIEKVNSVLPQTQCAQCGYPGCRPYAEAIIVQHERINRCPPGGDRTIADLANLLGTTVLPLDTDCGEQKPVQVAVIDEAACIGCTLCIHACPVDAIVGAGKLMHTVISDECTGCELCLPPCPVDCIDLVTPTITAGNWQWPRPD